MSPPANPPVRNILHQTIDLSEQPESPPRTEDDEQFYKDILSHLLYRRWTGPERENICQMCFTATENEDRGLCTRCHLADVAPVFYYDPSVSLWNQSRSNVYKPRPLIHSKGAAYSLLKCADCEETIPRFERIRLYCCKNWVCLFCYVSAVQERIPYCPCCNSRMAVFLWALKFYFQRHALKAGFHEFELLKTEQELIDAVKSDPELAVRHAKFSEAKWMVEKFSDFRNWFIYSTDRKFDA